MKQRQLQKSRLRFSPNAWFTCIILLSSTIFSAPTLPVLADTVLACGSGGEEDFSAKGEASSMFSIGGFCPSQPFRAEEELAKWINHLKNFGVCSTFPEFNEVKAQAEKDAIARCNRLGNEAKSVTCDANFGTQFCSDGCLKNTTPLDPLGCAIKPAVTDCEETDIIAMGSAECFELYCVPSCSTKAEGTFRIACEDCRRRTDCSQYDAFLSELMAEREKLEKAINSFDPSSGAFAQLFAWVSRVNAIASLIKNLRGLVCGNSL
ncbi:MAG: hypothetical protein KDD70_08570 [Bdellovibrionales bacterium]|nr:hypothetical protein [Bdellovibrionales bacterium]